MFRSPQGEAPPAPRELTPDARRDAAVHGRFLRLFGGIWALVGGSLSALFTLMALFLRGSLIGTLIGAAFGLVGLGLYYLGRVKQREALHVFREGVETTGVVTKVFKDFRVRVNRQHPWRVVYELHGPDGQPVSGTATFWGDRPNAREDDRVVVLYDPQAPWRSVLWTRLDDERELQVRVAAPTARIGEPEALAEDVDTEAEPIERRRRL